MSLKNQVQVGDVCFGDDARFVLMGGPCVIESEKHARLMAEKIKKITADHGVPYIFKASYDKANRSALNSFRGPGLKEGLRILAAIKKDLDVPVVSDVHSVEEVGPAGEVLDILQIPAFLSRQTDLLVAAAKTGRVVNVKKGQFLSPWDAKNIVDKIEGSGSQKILLTDRGTSFGYNNLVSDFRSIPVMRSFGYPVVYDVTHSVQIPGGAGQASSGKSEFIPTLARCGVVAGADALFMEIHDQPEKALSDGPNAMHLDQLGDLLDILNELKAVLSQRQVEAIV